MSEAKEKDRILAQIKAFKPHNEIEGLSKYIYDLERDGFISVKYDTEKNPIIIRLTTDGKAFLDSGGYTTRHKTERKSKLSAKAWAAITFVLGIVLTELMHILAERLAK